MSTTSQRAAAARSAQPHSAHKPASANCLPDNLPETPEIQENGNLSRSSAGPSQPVPPPGDSAELAADQEVRTSLAAAGSPDWPDDAAPISCHENQNAGKNAGRGQSENPPPAEPDPLAELLYRAISAAQVSRGRPAALDEGAKGQLVALLSVGMSMRQAASVLGVSHTTIQNALKAEPELNERINAARFQAQLQPLACVIREARRSWKAATWLLKYLDHKISTREETPDEQYDRQNRERDEFFSRPFPKRRSS